MIKSTIIIIDNNFILPGNLNNPLTLIISLILFMTLVSVILNSIDEWLPTFLRSMNCIMLFYLTYYFSRAGKLSEKLAHCLILITLFIALCFGVNEILFGNVQFLNKAYRISGNFVNHPLGYALLLFVTLTYIFSFITFHNTQIMIKLFALIIFVVSFILFIETHSRILTVAFFVSIFGTYILIEQKKLKKILLVSECFVLLILLFYLALETNVLPRIQDLIITKGTDPSTMIRVTIIKESIENFVGIYKLIGIGLGGFNHYFYDITGLLNVAAHNDYLLFFIEGGLIVGVMYLTFQIWVLLVIKEKIKILKKENFSDNILFLGITSMILFIGIEIFGFLINHFYYYQSENLVWIIIGLFFGTYSIKFKNPSS